MSRLRPGRAVCLAAVVALGVGLGGCSADGTPDGNVTAQHDGVPFEYQVPASFTEQSVDELNTRGDVRALRALDKVNVIAVRRLSGRSPFVTHQRVLGQRVTSVVSPVEGFPGWTFECQYSAARRSEVLKACANAAATVRRR